MDAYEQALAYLDEHKLPVCVAAWSEGERIVIVAAVTLNASDKRYARAVNPATRAAFILGSTMRVRQTIREEGVIPS